jgi:uncharacterized MAPEG superfamily protein
VLPYVWVTASMRAKRQQFGSVDNKHPREQNAKLTGWGARALSAQMNAWEALAYFAPAVIVAHLTHADAVWSARLAESFVVVRLLHGIAYLADIDKLRSFCFLIGICCALGLFLLAPVMGQG